MPSSTPIPDEVLNRLWRTASFDADRAVIDLYAHHDQAGTTPTPADVREEGDR